MFTKKHYAKFIVALSTIGEKQKQPNVHELLGKPGVVGPHGGM